MENVNADVKVWGVKVDITDVFSEERLSLVPASTETVTKTLRGRAFITCTLLLVRQDFSLKNFLELVTAILPSNTSETLS